MERSELAFHLALNLYAAVLIYLILLSGNLFSDQKINILIAALGARTLSYLLNDHFWGGLLVSFPFVKNCGKTKICQYLIESEKRLSKASSIHACTVYGSIVRGEFHDKSDLDVRYIRKSGIINAIGAASFAARERLIAFFSMIPLDSFVGDTEQFLDKMRDDEPPIIIKDSTGSMAKRYSTYARLDLFIKTFC